MALSRLCTGQPCSNAYRPEASKTEYRNSALYVQGVPPWGMTNYQNGPQWTTTADNTSGTHQTAPQRLKKYKHII